MTNSDKFDLVLDDFVKRYGSGDATGGLPKIKTDTGAELDKAGSALTNDTLEVTQTNLLDSAGLVLTEIKSQERLDTLLIAALYLYLVIALVVCMFAWSQWLGASMVAVFTWSQHLRIRSEDAKTRKLKAYLIVETYKKLSSKELADLIHGIEIKVRLRKKRVFPTREK
ncbi:hypothetical protein MCEMSE15_01655 [Fimbriimonadaceae bacterium]